MRTGRRDKRHPPMRNGPKTARDRSVTIVDSDEKSQPRTNSPGTPNGHDGEERDHHREVRDRSRLRDRPINNKPPGITTTLCDIQNKVRERTAARGKIVQPQSLIPPLQPRFHDPHLKFKNMIHYPELPIRSVSETGSPSEQYRRWVNEEPCRATEIRQEIERWKRHFRLAKGKPVELEDFEQDGLNKSVWWWQFLIEMNELNSKDIHYN